MVKQFRSACDFEGTIFQRGDGYICHYLSPLQESQNGAFAEATIIRVVGAYTLHQRRRKVC
jgi:hypothetical protein